MRGAFLGSAVVSLALASALSTASASHAPSTAPAAQRVVVQGASVAAASTAVRHAGGQVVRELPVVDGVAAFLPAGAVLPGVVVTPDALVEPQSIEGAAPARNVYREAVDAVNLPEPRAGVAPTVAIIDTGVSDVGGLGARLLSVPHPTVKGQTARCANFSSEQTCDDTYGHGTFLAGLIAGEGAYPGMSSRARLVSVKIAGRDGAADVSQVLAGIQYVVSFKDELGIKVLNLSLGSNSNHDHRSDPLNRAVERAWRAGIVVVVAASNRGPGAQTVSKPADDPLVLTVGAVDDRGTVRDEDDVVPHFSGRGPVVQGPEGDQVKVYKPDVVAPGVGLVSLSVPGSHIEQSAPPSGIPGYRRGSGTSQATAVVSGAAALLLDRRSLTPDEVKASLMLAAHHVDGTSWSQAGAGMIDVERALHVDVTGFRQRDPERRAFHGLGLTRAELLVTGVGCGALNAAKAFDSKCAHVHDDETAQAGGPFGATEAAFDAAAFDEQEWTGQSWYGSQWAQGQSWYGQSWYGQSWYGQSWYSTDGTAEPAGPASTDSSASRDGELTPLGTVLPGSAWYGVWK